MDGTTTQPGPAFVDGIGQWHNIDLMALTAIRAQQREDWTVAGMCILLPGVLDRVLELTAGGGYEEALPDTERRSIMDRGEVVDHVVTQVSEIQICRYDLGDPGHPCLFITACEPMWDGDPNQDRPLIEQAVLADTPVERGAPNMDWPQFMNPRQLDEFINKLNAQRNWLAETDPSARAEM